MADEYVNALECNDIARQRFKDCLIKFESAAPAGPLEQAMHVFDFDVHESHHPFLDRLYKHVRATALAEAGEALRANGSLAAIHSQRAIILEDYQVVLQGSELDTKTGETHIHFEVAPPVGDIQVTRGISAK